MTISIEALIYLAALMPVIGYSVHRVRKHNDGLRLFCSLVMLFVWFCLAYIQKTTQDYTPVYALLALDFVTAITFFSVAVHYKQLWIIWLGFFQTASLLANAVYLLGGSSMDTELITTMNVIGYFSMAWIIFGSGILIMLNQGVNRGFLPASLLPLVHSRTSGPES